MYRRGAASPKPPAVFTDVLPPLRLRLPFLPGKLKLAGDLSPAWLGLTVSVKTLRMHFLCIRLDHKGKQRALMNSFVYDDNTFLSPAIDLPSKLIKRANLALFTAPSLKVMSESTDRGCLLFKIQMKIIIISLPGGWQSTAGGVLPTSLKKMSWLKANLNDLVKLTCICPSFKVCTNA